MKYLQNSSYWHEDLQGILSERTKFQSLQNNLETDLLIIGAGFAGLSAAFHCLIENPEARVTIVEAEIAGFGASGRNAGFIEPHLLAMSWLFESSLPEGEAKWALSAIVKRAERTLQFIESLGIDFEYTPCTGVLNAVSYLAEDVLKNLQAKLDENAVESQWYDAAAANEKWGVGGGGALTFSAHSIHPAKLALGLADLLDKKGCEIYEKTKIVSIIEDNGKIRATTQNSETIFANRCVIATNAWAAKLDLHSKAINNGDSVSCTMIASKPLPNEVLAKAGSDLKALVAEVTTGFSYRRVHKGRILYGGFDDASTEAIAPPLEKNVKKLITEAHKEMPWLKGIDFEMAWAGPIFSPSNDLPAIESSLHLPNTAIITGNGSSGVPWALLCGGMLSGVIGFEGDSEGERLRQAMQNTKIPLMDLAGVGASAVWYAIKKTVSKI